MKYIKKFEIHSFDDDLKIEIVNTASNDDDEKLKEYLYKYKDYNFDFVYNDGYTPFLYGVLFDCKKTVKLLIKNGSNVDKQADTHKDNGLIICVLRKQYEMLDILIDAGADWNIEDSEGNDFLDYFEQPLKRKYNIVGNKDKIIKKYPEKYQEYLIKKEAKKYNL